MKYGLRGSDGVVGMPDGSIVLTTNGGVGKIDRPPITTASFERRAFEKIRRRNVDVAMHVQSLNSLAGQAFCVLNGLTEIDATAL